PALPALHRRGGVRRARRPPHWPAPADHARSRLRPSDRDGRIRGRVRLVARLELQPLAAVAAFRGDPGCDRRRARGRCPRRLRRQVADAGGRGGARAALGRAGRRRGRCRPRGVVPAPAHRPSATIALHNVPGAGPTRKVAATIRLHPPDAAKNARWLTVTAWQGHGAVVDRLKKIGPGVYRTTHEIPVSGPKWKSTLRL